MNWEQFALGVATASFVWYLYERSKQKHRTCMYCKHFGIAKCNIHTHMYWVSPSYFCGHFERK